MQIDFNDRDRYQVLASTGVPGQRSKLRRLHSVAIVAWVILFAIVLTILLSGKAHAVDPNGDPYPIAHYPLAGSGVIVQIETPDWGQREELQRVSDGVNGLSIKVGRCVDGVSCIRVVARHYGGSLKAYATTTYGAPGHVWWKYRVIRVDLDLVPETGEHNARAVVAHELGHALGLGHHKANDGVCGAIPDIEHFSPGELRALNRAYQR